MDSEKHPRQAALLTRVRAEVCEGVTEAFITAKDAHIDGFCAGGSGHITINPIPSAVETLLHESLHRMYPRWGEKRIDREAKRLLSCMTDRDVRSLYRLYQAHKYERKSTVNLDAD